MFIYIYQHFIRKLLLDTYKLIDTGNPCWKKWNLDGRNQWESFKAHYICFLRP